MRFFAPRIRYLAALALTIALGLVSRACPVGWHLWDKSLGDALYAVAAYLVLRLILPRLPALIAAAVALGFCYGIEAFKCTGLPAAWASWRLSRWAFGTTPSWHNLVCYTLAIIIVAVLEVWVPHSCQRPATAGGSRTPRGSCQRDVA